MKVIRGFFLIALLTGFAWLFWTLARETGRDGKVEELAGMQADEDIGVEGVSFFEWKRDELVWALDAKKMKYYHQEKRVDFEDVDVSFQVPAGGTLQIKAKTIRYDTETGNLIAEGEVKGKNDQGYQFVTDTLAYDADKREVQTPDKVTLRKDRLTIEGIGMQGFLERRRIELGSSVRAHLLPLAGT